MTVAGVAALYTVYLVVNGQEPVKMVENTTLPSPITDSSFKVSETEVTVPDTRPTQLGGDAANTGTVTEEPDTRALNLERIKHDNLTCRFRLPSGQERSPTTRRKSWTMNVNSTDFRGHPGGQTYMTAASNMDNWMLMSHDARVDLYEDLGFSPEDTQQLVENHCVYDSHYQIGQSNSDP